MSDSLNEIDAYFGGELDAAGKREFEQRCQDDPDFAAEVALYIGMRNGLRAELRARKKAELESSPQPLPLAQPVRIVTLRRAAFLAAACVLIVASWFFFIRPVSPQKMAGRYIAAHLTTLGLNMGAADSLQSGIAAYNAGEYESAERLFSALVRDTAKAPEALKYLGLVRLKQEKYAAAIRDFDRLSTMDLYVNPGLFYKALTLMARSEDGDDAEAQEILKQIVARRSYGYETAKKWLKTR
ncbi:MAG: tetratricopeptide repeat protein [Mucilaginibacter polytrichastri]|nr:tetratricopeptide repeat protein [Mucilaginibacter polytrichastri]